MPDLRHTIQWLTFAVWIYHIVGASRIFRRPAKQSPIIPLLPISWSFLIYRIFTSPLETRLVIPGMLCLAGSIILFEWARRSIRGKLFSWAYSDDTPRFLWTSGPYAYIRNPFYSSYMISYLGVLMMFPGIAAAIAASILTLIFVMAAWSEERKFRRSPLADDYEAYRRRTGRFVPRLVR